MDNESKIAIAIELARKAARERGFYWFIDRIYRYSFEPKEKFVTGPYIEKVAERYELNRFTIDVTGRGHFKSSRLHADIMYAMFTDDGQGFEAPYFSFSKEMAQYQVKKLKQEISYNPFFATISDMKVQAESVLGYRWKDSDGLMSVEPRGLLGNSRGLHSERLYVDDPLKTEDDSPGAPPDPVSIRKINAAMRSDILPMLKLGGICRIVSTPQTVYDFFFDQRGFGSKFSIDITPAILDEVNKVVLWPELWSWKRLQEERKVMNDEDKFAREYLVQPASTSRSYVKKDKLLAVSSATSLEFAPHPELEDHDIVGGHDIGKTRHPSYLALFDKVFVKVDEEGKDIYRFDQIFSKWMDNWEYGRQVEYLNTICEFFHVSSLRVDGTRGEFDSFEEQKKLDKAIELFSMGGFRKKSSIAACFQTLVNNGLISIVNERRTLNHILLVDGNLNSAEILNGPERGHGDSFWGIALGVWSTEKKVPKIWSLYDDEPNSPSSTLDTDAPTDEREKTWASSTPNDGNRRFWV